jgi:hypothetical protein
MKWHDDGSSSKGHGVDFRTVFNGDIFLVSAERPQLLQY